MEKNKKVHLREKKQCDRLMGTMSNLLVDTKGPSTLLQKPCSTLFTLMGNCSDTQVRTLTTVKYFSWSHLNEQTHLKI